MKNIFLHIWALLSGKEQQNEALKAYMEQWRAYWGRGEEQDAWLIE